MEQNSLCRLPSELLYEITSYITHAKDLVSLFLSSHFFCSLLSSPPFFPSLWTTAYSDTFGEKYYRVIIPVPELSFFVHFPAEIYQHVLALSSLPRWAAKKFKTTEHLLPGSLLILNFVATSKYLFVCGQATKYTAETPIFVIDLAKNKLITDILVPGSRFDLPVGEVMIKASSDRIFASYRSIHSIPDKTKPIPLYQIIQFLDNPNLSISLGEPGSPPYKKQKIESQNSLSLNLHRYLGPALFDPREARHILDEYHKGSYMKADYFVFPAEMLSGESIDTEEENFKLTIINITKGTVCHTIDPQPLIQKLPNVLAPEGNDKVQIKIDTQTNTLWYMINSLLMEWSLDTGQVLLCGQIKFGTKTRRFALGKEIVVVLVRISPPQADVVEKAFVVYSRKDMTELYRLPKEDYLVNDVRLFVSCDRVLYSGGSGVHHKDGVYILNKDFTQTRIGIAEVKSKEGDHCYTTLAQVKKDRFLTLTEGNVSVLTLWKWGGVNGDKPKVVCCLRLDLDLGLHEHGYPHFLMLPMFIAIRFPTIGKIAVIGCLESDEMRDGETGEDPLRFDID